MLTETEAARRAKISAARLGVKHSARTRQKISDAHMGKRHSEESKRKMGRKGKRKPRENAMGPDLLARVMPPPDLRVQGKRPSQEPPVFRIRQASEFHRSLCPQLGVADYVLVVPAATVATLRRWSDAAPLYDARTLRAGAPVHDLVITEQARPDLVAVHGWKQVLGVNLRDSRGMCGTVRMLGGKIPVRERMVVFIPDDTDGEKPLAILALVGTHPQETPLTETPLKQE